MTGQIVEITRYPIKSHGWEALDRILLPAGSSMPWDRVWAVAHERSQADGLQWVPCQNFSRVFKAPRLQAISAQLDERTATVTLSHPDLMRLRFRPDDEGEMLIAWAKALMPENRAASARVIRAQGHAFTDSDFPSVTLCNRASHRAVEQRIGTKLSPLRWRGNIWFDGLAPWEEFDWIDREVRIGKAIVIPRERTERCLATHANPETGIRNANVLAALEHWEHRDFSVRAEIVEGGDIALGDGIGRA